MPHKVPFNALIPFMKILEVHAPLLHVQWVEEADFFIVQAIAVFMDKIKYPFYGIGNFTFT
jgi:hypothetical protein